jgi:hypothetical protein
MGGGLKVVKALRHGFKVVGIDPNSVKGAALVASYKE